MDHHRRGSVLHGNCGRDAGANQNPVSHEAGPAQWRLQGRPESPTLAAEGLGSTGNATTGGIPLRPARHRIRIIPPRLPLLGSFVDSLVRGAIRRKDQTVRRPLIRLKTRTITAMTSRRWIRLPPTWKLKPSSHRIARITNIVQSI